MQASEVQVASERVRMRFAEGVGIEEILAEMRTGGADKIDSIRVLKSALSISLGEAKNLVDQSETWSDRHADDRVFHAAVWKASSQLQRGEGKGIEVVIDQRQSESNSD